MRSVLLFFCVLLMTNASALTCTTVASGNFTDTNVWDCGCDPTLCDTLIIAHQLFAADDISLAGVTVYITPTGSLSGTFNLVLQGELINEGSLDVVKFNTLPGGDLRNLGTITCAVFVSVSDSSFNVGSITSSDSLVVGLYRPFQNDGVMITQVLYSLGPLTNLGAIESVSCLANPFFNSGTFSVEEMLFCTGSFWNEAEISAGHMTVLSGLDNFGEIIIHGLFTHGIDTIDSADGRLQANSTIRTRDFINSLGSEIRGPGQLCIEGYSENRGVLRGSLVICDLSPTMDVAPYLDVNTGTFWMSVTYCETSSCTWTSVSDETTESVVQINSNPAVDVLNIQLSSPSIAVARIEVRDLGGRLVQQLEGPFADHILLHRRGLAGGTYLIRVLQASGQAVATQLVVFTD